MKRPLDAGRHKRAAIEDDPHAVIAGSRPKHTILFLAGPPIGIGPLSLDQDARAIQGELERSGYRDCFDFETRWAVEPLDLLRELRKLRPTVVHVSGHGVQQHGLHFQHPDGRAQVVSMPAITMTFGAAGASVKLVVLAAGHTVSQAEALLAHVDCVVGMDGPILDSAARHFSIGFYGGLADGESVAAAYYQGLAAIRLTEKSVGDHAATNRRGAVGPEDDLGENRSEAERPTLRVRAGIEADRLVLVTGPPSHGFQEHRLLELLRLLAPAIAPPNAARPDLFREIIQPAFEDLRDVHRDYVAMFRRMQRRIPARRDDPHYQPSVKAAAEELRDMRARSSPLRVELRKLAEHLQRKPLSAQARTFADALLDYFPDGSLREPSDHRDARWWKTASSLLLDQIDEDLSAAKEHDLAGLIHDTIVTLETGWAATCDAFQALRLVQFG